MRAHTVNVVDAEQWNDEFAREFDIDAFYADASVLVRWVTKRRMRLIKNLVEPRPGERILEVGCGGGHILRMFPGNELVGIDVSGEMLQKSERNLKGFNVTLHRGELEEVALPKHGFDRIICSEVLEHVVDPYSLIPEMSKLLAPSGQLVVTIPNDAWIDAIKKFVRKTGLQYVPPFRKIGWGGDKYHLHAWTKTEMLAELSQHFLVERVAVAPFSMIPLHFAFVCSPKPSS